MFSVKMLIAVVLECRKTEIRAIDDLLAQIEDTERLADALHFAPEMEGYGLLEILAPWPGFEPESQAVCAKTTGLDDRPLHYQGFALLTPNTDIKFMGSIMPSSLKVSLLLHLLAALPSASAPAWPHPRCSLSGTLQVLCLPC
jgi:hypothetical protein